MIECMDRVHEHHYCHCDCEETKGMLLTHIFKQDIHTSIDDIKKIIDEKLKAAFDSVDDNNDNCNCDIYVPTKLSEFENDVPYLVAKDIEQFVTKEELELYLNNWTPDIEIGDLFDASLYYTKREIDDRFKNYYTKSYIDSLMSNYFTKSEIETIIKGIKPGGDTTIINGATVNVETIQNSGTRIAVIKVKNPNEEEKTHVIYAPTSTSGGGDTPDPSPSGKGSVYVEIFAKATSFYNYDRLCEALVLSSGKPIGNFDWTTREVYGIESTNPWKTSLSNAFGGSTPKYGDVIYRSTRHFYEDGAEEQWSTPMLYIGDWSFLDNYQARIYAKGSDGRTPELSPTAGSYNFATKTLTTPYGWQDSLDGLDPNTLEIWQSWRTFYSDDTVTTWLTPPIRLITSNTVIDGIDSITNTSIGIQVFKATNGTTPSTPVTKASSIYDFDNNTFTLPDGWYVSPSAAIDADRENVVWVSFNNVIKTNDQYTFGRWTSPVKYVDIDSILKEADLNANTIAGTAIDNAFTDINRVKEELDKSVEGYTKVVDAFNVLYEWKETTDAQTMDSSQVNEIAGRVISSYSDLVNYCSGPDFYKQVVVVGGKKYRYIATTAELLTQVATLDADLKTVKTAVEEIDADKIRLLVSKGFTDTATWIPITKEEYDNTDTKNRQYSSVYPPVGTPRFGDVYKVSQDFDGKPLASGKEIYLKAYYPVSTGFMNILNDSLNFGIVDDNNGNKAVLNMYFKDKYGSVTELTSNRIVLNGDVIAKAIASKELNINNKTYLLQDGTVRMAMGTSGSSIFNTDGSGQLAGGLVQWGTGIGTVTDKFAVKVTGHMEAQSGFIGYDPTSGKTGWVIGNVGGIPAIVGKDSQLNELQLTTQYLASLSASGKYNWMLNADGTGGFGAKSGSNGNYNLTWDQNGNVTMEGKIKADSGKIGGWDIGNVATGNGTVPALYSTNEDHTIQVTPVELMSRTNTGVAKWELRRDGTGQIANGNIDWNKSGDLTVRGDVLAERFQAQDGVTNPILRVNNNRVEFCSPNGTPKAWFDYDESDGTMLLWFVDNTGKEYKIDFRYLLANVTAKKVIGMANGPYLTTLGALINGQSYPEIWKKENVYYDEQACNNLLNGNYYERVFLGVGIIVKPEGKDFCVFRPGCNIYIEYNFTSGRPTYNKCIISVPKFTIEGTTIKNNEGQYVYITSEAQSSEYIGKTCYADGGKTYTLNGGHTVYKYDASADNSTQLNRMTQFKPEKGTVYTYSTSSSNYLEASYRYINLIN